ncbi:MAG: HD domain-containing protein [Calditrichaeota bacterium]|nr:HD domain-containing protein [Calditrichota bacterium]
MASITSKVAEHVTAYLNENLDKKFHFHNLKHTENTVKAVKEIAENSNVSNQDKELLEIAAWFHDAGYTATYEGHEQRSAELAEEFLADAGCSSEKIKKISALILATKIDSKPQNLLEKIIRDADLSHLAKKSGPKKAQKLRQELNEMCNKSFSDKEWLNIDKNFYSKTRYFTDYAKQNWQPRLDENLQKISEKLASLNNSGSTMNTDQLNEQMENTKEKTAGLSEKELKKLQKIKMSERGVETVFRTTSRNHLRLSAMADAKANTLISISALLISIIISFLADSLDVQPFLTIPTSLLLLICVLTIVFATLSTRPKVTKLGLTKEDIKQRRGNLLFFGNFYQMPLEDYEWGMNELMTDREYLYSNLTKDIYFLGLVLAKKYKFLSIAYNVFMYGIIVSVASFLFVINF